MRYYKTLARKHAVLFVAMTQGDQQDIKKAEKKMRVASYKLNNTEIKKPAAYLVN